MSVQAISYVIEHSRHKGSYLLTLLMIANHAHADGTGAWPSINTLARETRLSTRGVRYCIERLRESGEMAVIRDGGPKGSNAYRIFMGQSLPQSKSGMGQDLKPMRQPSVAHGAIAIATESKNRPLEPSPNAELILLAIEESQKTGADVDEILRAWRTAS